MSNLNQEIIDAVLALVDNIPSGHVATYGQIARLIGRPKNARLVGKILSQSELYGSKHPCTWLVRPETLALGRGSGLEG